MPHAQRTLSRAVSSLLAVALVASGLGAMTVAEAGPAAAAVSTTRTLAEKPPAAPGATWVRAAHQASSADARTVFRASVLHAARKKRGSATFVLRQVVQGEVVASTRVTVGSPRSWRRSQVSLRTARAGGTVELLVRKPSRARLRVKIRDASITPVRAVGTPARPVTPPVVTPPVVTPPVVTPPVVTPPVVTPPVVTPPVVTPPTTEAPVVVSDDFDRSVAKGWGSSRGGGDWVVYGDPDRASVSGGQATLVTSGPLTHGADLPTWKSSESRVSVDFSVDKAYEGSGEGMYVAVVGRKVGDSSYTARLVLTPQRTVQLYLLRNGAGIAPARTIPGLTVEPGAAYRLAVEVAGTSPTTIAATVWRVGAARPGVPHASAVDSTASLQAAGTTGLFVYVPRDTSNGPITTRFDNLEVRSSSHVEQPPVVQPPVVQPPVVQPPVVQPPVVQPPEGAGMVEPEAVAGSAPVGATSYPVPSGAVVVAPTGNDSAAGTLAAPLRTLARALQVAKSGQTIVLRAGSYHETVVTPREKRLSIQSYPGEAVWMDGSSPVTGFAASGSTYVRSGWTTKFDSSPTYTRGAADSTTPGWQWINPAFPMAAHPDQVWIDGVAQQQVRTLSQVGPGKFFVDYAADRLHLGTNPAGKEVRASDLVTAMTVLGAGSVVRGIGVRRYAPSVCDMGALRIVSGADGSSVENLVLVDNATTGLSVAATRVTMAKVTSSRNGFLGIHSVYADHLKASLLRVERNNTEKFNYAPAAGGYKLTRSRTVSVTDSVFNHNAGAGLWFDESIYDITANNNDVRNNLDAGIIFELSSKIVAVNNDIRDNSYAGLLVHNANHVRAWNNTITGNRLGVWITQDSRRPHNSTGRDPRQVNPDPTMTWVVGDVRLSNNLIGNLTPGDNWCATLCVEDKSKVLTGAQMGVTVNGNVYNRSAASVPWSLTRWAAGGSGMVHHENLAAFRSATGQEVNGHEIRGSSAVDAKGRYSPAVTSAGAAGTVGLPLPADIAAMAGATSGSKVIGPVRR